MSKKVLCSICGKDDYIIVARSDGGGFFFENLKDGPKQYCDYCFELAHGGDTKYCRKKDKKPSETKQPEQSQ